MKIYSGASKECKVSASMLGEQYGEYKRMPRYKAVLIFASRQGCYF
jgi:hypothetical protein